MVNEIILYYDARSIKHQIKGIELFELTHNLIVCNEVVVESHLDLSITTSKVYRYLLMMECASQTRYKSSLEETKFLLCRKVNFSYKDIFINWW